MLPSLLSNSVFLLSKEDKPDSAAAAALNLSPNGIGSINMSVEINGTIYAGEKGLLLGGWECPAGCGEGGTLLGILIFQLLIFLL